MAILKQGCQKHGAVFFAKLFQDFLFVLGINTISQFLG